jgi:hypothetical protein
MTPFMLGRWVYLSVGAGWQAVLEHQYSLATLLVVVPISPVSGSGSRLVVTALSFYHRRHAGFVPSE